MTGPLAGVRVVEAANVVAGPTAGQVLADFGADVIKIEHPARGDDLRHQGKQRNGVGLWWKVIGRNKRTVAIDLSQTDGAGLFRRLAARADVVIESFRPGTLERWGLSYEELAKDNPGLVLLRVTGFGQDGPYARRPAFGTLIEAMSGFAAATGEPGGPPTLPPIGLADTVAGISGAAAVVMALYARDTRGGAGQVIDQSILEPLVAALAPQATVADQLGVAPERLGNRSELNAPRNAYPTADSAWVAISTSTNSVATRLLHLVGHPEVVDEPWFATGRGRAAHRDELDTYVANWIAGRTQADVLAALAEADVAGAPVWNATQLLDDPHVVARGVLPAVDDPDLGPVRMPAVLFRMSATPGTIRHAGRPLGADTDAVLADELGLDAATIDDLRSRGTIA